MLLIAMTKWPVPISFTSRHPLKMNIFALGFADDQEKYIFWETIVINAGSQPVVPPIPDLTESNRIFSSDALLDLAILTFLDPPFSRIGDNEAQAKSKGHHVRAMTLPSAAIPRANVRSKTDGLIKLIADTNDDQILGIHLFCAKSHENINIIKILTDAHLPYATLRDMIFTHSTMCEAFNEPP